MFVTHSRSPSYKRWLMSFPEGGKSSCTQIILGGNSGKKLLLQLFSYYFKRIWKKTSKKKQRQPKLHPKDRLKPIGR